MLPHCPTCRPLRRCSGPWLFGSGYNLNQIAKALNTAAKVGTLGNVEALKATTELAALERSLNSLRDFLAKG
ncbi:plasmid mobilization relaxosome protein MobC, partial [Neisseria gonorrhoeae]|uniref:plasmid mobilization relaxosome protein MobC n=1 Tax=Neisseria gonorrhoeae TaxID=485 RepID=UPI001F4983D9